MQNSSEQSSMHKPLPQGETERELYSEKKAAFIDAMECLYIHNNHSARNVFCERWPAAAEYIFSPKLLEFDQRGVQNDEEREERKQLEDEADIKRVELLSVFQGMEQRLVIYGSLQFEALEEIMRQISKPIAEYVFAERFVNKYFPDPNSVVQQAYVAPDERSSETANISAPISEDHTAQNNLDEHSDYIASSTTAINQMPRSLDYPEIAVTSEVITESIGHVDHSYLASTPQYDKQDENGESEEDLSWLNQVEEDEFAGIAPISVLEPEASMSNLPNTVRESANSQSEEIAPTMPSSVEAVEQSESPSPPSEGETQTQPQPRVPSLDDLDKHVTEMEKPKASEILPSDVAPRGGSDLPPIPGSEDSGEGEDIDSFFSKK
jgi:hypothetical protein